MIISTRGRYALRVMIDLSQQDPDSYTPLKEIAARQEISEKYLENIPEFSFRLKVKISCHTRIYPWASRKGRRLPPDKISGRIHSRFDSSCNRRKSCSCSVSGGSCTGMCTCGSVSDTSDLGKTG